MLTEDQKIELRRFLGYPPGGNPAVSPTGGPQLADGMLGWRFFQASGALEWKMNNLQPLEESMILGYSTGVVNFSTYPDVSVPVGAGKDLAITILIDEEVVDTISYTTSSTDNIFDAATAFASLVYASTALQALSFTALTPQRAGAYSQAARPPSLVAPFPGVQIMAPQDFTLTTVGVPPVTLAVQPGSGVFKSPKVLFEEEGEIKGFIPILTVLEGKIGSVSDNLDTTKADVWTARADELEVRQRLFHVWRTRLSLFLNSPLFEDTPHQARYMRGRKSCGIMTV